jgi:pre-mRNA-processing factor 8
MGMKHSTAMKFGVKLSTPREFYHYMHRPGHFLKFSGVAEEEDGGVEREDLFE